MTSVRRVLFFAAFCTASVAVPAAVATAAPATQQNPTTGQPGTTAGFNCGPGNSAPTEPGNASSAPGSAFNESRPGTAGTVYAGNGPGSAHANSTAAVSQYDSACRQLSSH